VEKSGKSPYLENVNRLADVIAAIQAMGTYKFYKLPFEGWADRIVGDGTKADHWKRIFVEHPEFFRLDGPRERASLVWRRQYPKRFHVDEEKLLCSEAYDVLSETEKKRVSRASLTPADIKTLIDTAINLHSRSIERLRESRWWVPLLSSAVGGLIGAVLGVWFRG
jgi:hypothetical protein